MRRVLFVVVGVLLATAVPCMAQTPKAEFSAGYNVMKFSDESFPTGWYADVAANWGSNLALVGQVTGNYKKWDMEGGNVDGSFHTFGAGLRMLSRGANAAGFGHVLFGMSRVSASSSVSELDVNVSSSQSDSFLQLGAGVNLMQQAPIGVRIGGDYFRMISHGGENVFRFAVGIVIPIGR
jgi:hypothetical protein